MEQGKPGHPEEVAAATDEGSLHFVSGEVDLGDSR
jgi:hypothetical protein